VVIWYFSVLGIFYGEKSGNLQSKPSSAENEASACSRFLLWCLKCHPVHHLSSKTIFIRSDLFSFIKSSQIVKSRFRGMPELKICGFGVERVKKGPIHKKFTILNIFVYQCKQFYNCKQFYKSQKVYNFQHYYVYQCKQAIY
jgi:hypothetical protein